MAAALPLRGGLLVEFGSGDPRASPLSGRIEEVSLTFQPPRPVVSGTPYRVRQVHGQVPRELADFVGQTSFVLTVDGEDYEVRGPGIEIDGLVRVFEKDELGHGKDIRVWTVRRHADGDLFTAEHAPS